MAIKHDNVQCVSVSFADPTADLVLPILLVPGQGIRILDAYVAFTATTAADATNKITMSLLDGGAAGAGTTEMAVRTGGASVGWTAGTFHALTVSQVELNADSHLMLKYDESGTVAPGVGVVTVHYVLGGLE